MGQGDARPTGYVEETSRAGDNEVNYTGPKNSSGKKSKDLEFLLSRWRTEIHSFFTLWGEFGPTLEDVMMLTSLPTFGDI